MASERTTITGATWTQVGTGPATVQLISTGIPVMLVCATVSPTGNDGLVLINQGDSHTFQLTNAIWALVVNPASSAVVAVQPE
jgi:carbohydrate-binding DOMON domain-containing protein